MSSVPDFKNIARELVVAAENLNAVADKYQATLVNIDEQLKTFNIGLEAWNEDVIGKSPNSWRLGYARVNDKWGLTINRQDGTLVLLVEATRVERMLSCLYISGVITALLAVA